LEIYYGIPSHATDFASPSIWRLIIRIVDASSVKFDLALVFVDAIKTVAVGVDAEILDPIATNPHSAERDA
jgi:hypothetical protein